jgi:hypothetical protein
MILVTLGSGMGEMWGSLTSLKLECMVSAKADMRYSGFVAPKSLDKDGSS